MPMFRTAILIALSIFFFSCATANRSARKVEPGTVTLSYIPLLSASARVALSEHVETRLSVWVDRPVFDIFLRTADDDRRLFNFGLAFGSTLPFVFGDPEIKRTDYFISLTASSHFFNRLFPYITTSYFTDFKQGKHHFYEVSFGCETIVYRFEKSTKAIIVTPEIIWNPAWDTYPFNTKIGGTLGVGFSFPLYKD